MKSLSDPSWDLQIQDEAHEMQVNIGFFFQRASPLTTQFWRDVLKRMYGGPAWDQRHVNELLETSTRRLSTPESERQFVTATGMKVVVLPGELFWGFHLG